MGESDLPEPADGTSEPGLAQLLSREPEPELVLEAAEVLQRLFGLLDARQRRIVELKMKGHTPVLIATDGGFALRTVERELAFVRELWLKEVSP